MKNKCIYVGVILILLFCLEAHAQNNMNFFIPSEHLSITSNKTTNLIFPYSVQSIDRGSKDILVQQPGGTENIVQVKADKPGFAQTNLSIITVDGRLYSFTVDYDEQPNQLNIAIGKDGQTLTSQNARINFSTGYDEASIKSVSQKILAMKVRHWKTDRGYQMKLQLDGIYINQDILYFRLQLQNKSNVSFDAENINFLIKEKQNSKRTATQELGLTPVYSYNAFAKIEAHSVATCIIALPKFTLPDSKYLSIQLLEKSGGRHLNLVIKNRQIMKAVTVDTL